MIYLQNDIYLKKPLNVLSIKMVKYRFVDYSEA